jgi:hypothetical protein
LRKGDLIVSVAVAPTPQLVVVWLQATWRIQRWVDTDAPGSFELLASALNHKYIAVQNTRVVSEAEWRELGAKRGENAKVSDVPRVYAVR